jgi:23S rRNA (adenine1618-N6)-methyltransferase
MVGCDSNEPSIIVAKENIANFKESITIRLQSDNSHLFRGIIHKGEYYDFTMCNPPFYNSLEEALKVNASKRSNLKIKNDQRNFAGLANELYCNGGEALFIKRMIKESVQFQRQVGWFTCLLSRKQNLPKVIKQLTKLKATHKIVNMEQGNKKSRFIAWKFTP